MRKLTAFALLFFCATAVQAQEPVTPQPATIEAASAPPATRVSCVVSQPSATPPRSAVAELPASARASSAEEPATR